LQISEDSNLFIQVIKLKTIDQLKKFKILKYKATQAIVNEHNIFLKLKEQLIHIMQDIKWLDGMLAQ